ncbi:hypothetical protein QBC34DRAFT_300344 [Podospora aff. communis PSN243]|uniref:SMODS and SLOG-associating 2TM effector domain-containing protein n=1 Tax=Podospora aff. communis PSN243 TaxID=3040156 RepID=A0AAV9GIX1_9PEZI|nr:hypothetical protein QBC34DRAFT_300344 [Podospora aff. communis PSN243]
MASFIQASLRLLRSRKQQQPNFRPDEEQGVPAPQGSVATSSTTQGGYLPHMHPHLQPQDNHPEYPILTTAGPGSTTTTNDKLTLFRLMLGITAHPHLGFNVHSSTLPRPADNIGLYARVVHSEQVAKDSYKVFSAVINACYFLQIILAAALTALGAANADNKAITAFGAINTVIAGFLTYLKGSGLPARLKYFGNEWKKVREYIEQRERDFSHEGCGLDVDEVVGVVRGMYERARREVEINTPDSYNSMTNMRGGTAVGGGDGGVDGLGGRKGVEGDDALVGKLKTLDSTIRKLKESVEKTETKVYDAAHVVQEEGRHVVADIKHLGSVVREKETKP